MFTEGLVGCVVGQAAHKELGPGRVLLAGVVDHGGGRGGRGGRREHGGYGGRGRGGAGAGGRADSCGFGH